MNMLLVAIIAAYLLTVLFGYVLKGVNLSYLKKHGANVPAGFEKHINEALLRKTRDYTVENSRFSFVHSIFHNVILLVFLLGGVLEAYDAWVGSLGRGFILTGFIFFLVIVYAENLLTVPFSLYSTFKIENRYGFNTMTAGLWIRDFIKSLLLSTVLLGILIAAGLWIIETSPAYWWLWVWGFFLVFSLFVMYISPYVIEPLFNKFTPVDDPELEQDIRKLAHKAGIQVSKVFKMDASKRSRHTNAYFTGIGRVKRIVLYDTLLELMDRDEVVAVLAHEIGHWKKRHVLKRIVVSEVVAFVTFYIAFRVLQSDILIEIFSIENGSLFAKLVLLGFVGSIVSFPFTPLSAYFSRRHEREADRYATEITGLPGSMATSLVKLSKDNLSNLHPHPLYAAFYYSHPPVVRRVMELKTES